MDPLHEPQRWNAEVSTASTDPMAQPVERGGPPESRFRGHGGPTPRGEARARLSSPVCSRREAVSRRCHHRQFRSTSPAGPLAKPVPQSQSMPGGQQTILPVRQRSTSYFFGHGRPGSPPGARTPAPTRATPARTRTNSFLRIWHLMTSTAVPNAQVESSRIAGSSIP